VVTSSLVHYTFVKNNKVSFKLLYQNGQKRLLSDLIAYSFTDYWSGAISR
jgi:hypothetical protein